MSTTPDFPEPKKWRIPRYRPNHDLPPYRYVPLGRHPHPTMDQGGHMHDKVSAPSQEPSELAWMTNHYWLYGVDLFNHWYFWEATEYWTALWAALPKNEPPAQFIQALTMFSGGIIKAHCTELDGVRKFWQEGDARLSSLANHYSILWGVKLVKAHRDFRRFYKPLWKSGELPSLTKHVPQLRLPI